MKQYQVTITETLKKSITVEAKSKADALEVAKMKYYDEDVILDSDNFYDVDFELLNTSTTYRSGSIL